MTTDSNPVLSRVHAMAELWRDECSEDAIRLVVWRIPRNASRMMAAFFEMQKHEGAWNTPDYFLHLDSPFDTGFEYSRLLKESILGSYAESRASFEAQGIGWDWAGSSAATADSAAGVVELLHSFAGHYGKHFRHLAVVLEPERITSPSALERWLERALDLLPASLRLVLVDTAEDRQWQPLLDRHRARSRILQPSIDLFDVARETAAQSAGSGDTAAYRQQLTNLFTLVEKGSAAQVAQQAPVALRMAGQHGWFDQQSVVHSLIGGAWLKERDCTQAVAAYRRSRKCAEAARVQGNAAAGDLITQSWFSEAAAWLVNKQPVRAAVAYREAALTAAGIPNPMFVIEGHRMAGYCLEQVHDFERAQAEYLLAVQAGRELPVDQRAATTLGVALTDLMRLHDRFTVKAIDRTASTYCQQIAQAQERAEERASKLGDRPDAHALETIQTDMHRQFGRVFEDVRLERERLIERGGKPLRTVVAMGRELLHPAWNGLPEIRHPLDEEVEGWREPPPWQAQCDTQAPLPPPEALQTTAHRQEARA